MFSNSGASTSIDLYENGACKQNNILTGSSINLVTGSLIGRIGALRTAPGPIQPGAYGTAATAAITTTGGPFNDETFVLTDAVGLAVTFVFKTGVTTVDGTKDGDNVIIGVNGAVGSAAATGERIRDAINASDLEITAAEEVGPLRITLTQQGGGTAGNTAIDMSGVTTVTATSFTGGVNIPAGDGKLSASLD